MSNSHFAFMFPGQGSQSVAMLADFAEELVVKQTFAQASDVLNYDLWKLVSEGPEEELNETDRTQPALLTASTALWRLWLQQSDAKPKFVVGHSLGEYSALVAAGVLEFDQAVILVEKRGQFMQHAVPAGVGKMAAIIGLSDDLIELACEQAKQSQLVAPVNYNSPGQVVIAGNADAVERAIVLCKEKGAKRALPLPVSVPSHCALMKPAAKALSQILEDIDFSAPRIPVVNNVDVSVVESAAQIKNALERQLFSPVRWTESIQFLAQSGVTDLVECGAGNVLSGLARRIDRQLVSHQINTKVHFNQVVGSLY